MKITKKSFLFALLVCLPIISMMGNMKVGNNKYERRDYLGAIEQYKKTAEGNSNEKTVANAKYKIGECYSLLNEPKEAVSYLGEAIAGGVPTLEAYVLYGKNLLKMGEYARAKASFEEFDRLSPKDARIKNLIASCDFALKHSSKNPITPEQDLKGINTSEIEYGIGFYQDGIVYASVEQAKKGLSSRMYFSHGKDNFTSSRLVDMIKIRTGQNVGTFAIDTLDNILYYTRCNNNERDNCYIYTARYKKGKWKEKGALNIANRHANVAHPALSPDRQRLYFTANLEGGFGGTDIWYVTRNENGKWSKTPINVGSVVNTAGNEAFPYVVGNTLIFASDGHIGFGGYDLYSAQIDGKAVHKVQNLMKPINSSADDINLIVSEEKNEALLVSSRNISTKDDIFRFEGIFTSMMVSGHAYNNVTKEVLPNTQVVLSGMGKTHTTETNKDGYYYAFIEAGDLYKMFANAVGFLSDMAMIKAEKTTIGSFPVEQDFYLTPASMSISGRVYDMETNEPFINEDVLLLENGTLAQQTKTDITGRYSFTNLTNGKEYQVKVNKPNFLSITSKPFIYQEGDANNSSFDLASIPYGSDSFDPSGVGGVGGAGGMGNTSNVGGINGGRFAGREISINEIYYDFDNANLLPQSRFSLDKIILLLSSNPTLKLEFGSHTDTRGSAEYNLQLSNARAKSVVDYLIASGISRNRLSWKGYGKTNPVVKNAVTEEEHRLNRRTTFKIIER